MKNVVFFTKTWEVLAPCYLVRVFFFLSNFVFLVDEVHISLLNFKVYTKANDN